MTPDVLQRIQALEAANVKKAKKVITQTPSSGGYWNWISPEVLVEDTDSVSETGIDLSGIVGSGAKEVKLFIQCDFDEDGSSDQHWFYLYFKAPQVSADLVGFYMLTDGPADMGTSGTFELPLDGTGFRYFTTAEKAGGGALVGEFQFTITLLAWR